MAQAGGTPRPGNRLGTRGALGVALVLVLTGFLFAANARLSGGLAGRDATDLLGLVQVEAERSDQLATEVEELRAEVDRLTEAQIEGEQPGDPFSRSLVELAAGRVPVTGPGLTVRLSDAPTNVAYPDWVNLDMLVVHQQDLEAVINALWAGGAEAMTLQGERVISTSAFRCVGNVLSLHGRHYSPPYVVQAIGDPVELQAALGASRQVQLYQADVERVGLGLDISPQTELELPAYQGSLELEHADVPEGVDVYAAGLTP